MSLSLNIIIMGNGSEEQKIALAKHLAEHIQSTQPQKGRGMKFIVAGSDLMGDMLIDELDETGSSIL